MASEVVTQNEPMLSTSAESSNRYPLAHCAPMILRMIVGYGFIAHGLAKLGRGPESFSIVLHGLGVPAPYLMAWLTILTEIGGGLAVFVGAFVTAASLPLAAILVVSIFSVHLRYGFSSIKLLAVTPAGPQFGPPGYELSLLYLAALVVLVLGGPGKLAIDNLRKHRR
jgi:putative oxidoreductase